MSYLVRLWNGLRRFVPPAGELPQQPNLIHMPPGGCPDGWTLVPDVFVDREGRVSPGCTLPGDPPVYDGPSGLLLHRGSPFCIDRVEPGETVRLDRVLQYRPSLNPRAEGLT